MIVVGVPWEMLADNLTKFLNIPVQPPHRLLLTSAISAVPTISLLSGMSPSLSRPGTLSVATMKIHPNKEDEHLLVRLTCVQLRSCTGPDLRRPPARWSRPGAHYVARLACVEWTLLVGLRGEARQRRCSPFQRSMRRHGRCLGSGLLLCSLCGGLIQTSSLCRRDHSS